MIFINNYRDFVGTITSPYAYTHAKERECTPSYGLISWNDHHVVFDTHTHTYTYNEAPDSDFNEDLCLMPDGQ